MEDGFVQVRELQRQLQRLRKDQEELEERNEELEALLGEAQNASKEDRHRHEAELEGLHRRVRSSPSLLLQESVPFPDPWWSNNLKLTYCRSNSWRQSWKNRMLKKKWRQTEKKWNSLSPTYSWWCSALFYTSLFPLCLLFITDALFLLAPS